MKHTLTYPQKDPAFRCRYNQTRRGVSVRHVNTGAAVTIRLVQIKPVRWLFRAKKWRSHTTDAPVDAVAGTNARSKP